MKSSSLSFESPATQAAAANGNSDGAISHRRLLLVGLWVFAGYYLGCKIGFALTFTPHPISVLWPPNAILVAALLLTPPRVWWFILLCAFPAHLAAQFESHVPSLMVLCWFVSNSCEALIGASLMRYLLRGPIQFTSVRSVATFCLCVVFIGPFLSSFLDAAFVIWNDWGSGSYWELVRVRLSSNALAALIIVPLVVTWSSDGIQGLRIARLSRYFEASALFIGLLLVSYVVFYELRSPADLAVLFLPLPVLLWAAVRFGSVGASTAISIVGFLAIWSASHGHGPFSSGTAEQNALSIQTFLIGLAIPLLFLATIVEERTSGKTELRESELRFQTLADAAPVLIWMAGVDKLCTFFNRPWLEFTGRTAAQELGNGWADGVHPDDLSNCLETYTTAFDARQPFVMQYRLRRNDGDYRWISDQGIPRYDAEGTFAGYIGSCVDVTDLVNTGAALRDSEERMRVAAEAVNLGIWEWDLSKDELWAPNARRTLLGWPASGRITMETFISRVHPDDRSRIRQEIAAAIQNGQDYDSEYRLVLPDNIIRWMATRGSVHFDGNGKPARLLGVSIDITARKQAELEAKQRRDELNHLSRLALMGEMSASIAHELNQPLAGILSNAGAGQRFIDRGNVDPKELRELLADISADARRASEVVRGIRGMIKKEQATRHRINLNDVVANVMHMISSDALLHACELKPSLEAGLPILEADPVQIQQVLINLVLNSFDAMRDIPASKRKVEIATRQERDGTVSISVRDHGLGISEETRSRLFEQFFTTKEEGLGMGLAIARSIVEAHGGTIEAQNADGGGARFHFTLPVTQVHDQ